mmetsp:Transcript_13448/g.19245  ORF Transcript_13448/g.19245 Transcript_13448/m.19245 type:complete len:205 (+) Transcript_13448:139-753(+)
MDRRIDSNGKKALLDRAFDRIIGSQNQKIAMQKKMEGNDKAEDAYRQALEREREAANNRKRKAISVEHEELARTTGLSGQVVALMARNMPEDDINNNGNSSCSDDEVIRKGRKSSKKKKRSKKSDAKKRKHKSSEKSRKNKHRPDNQDDDSANSSMRGNESESNEHNVEYSSTDISPESRSKRKAKVTKNHKKSHRKQSKKRRR